MLLLVDEKAFVVFTVCVWVWAFLCVCVCVQFRETIHSVQACTSETQITSDMCVREKGLSVYDFGVF